MERNVLTQHLNFSGSRFETGYVNPKVNLKFFIPAKSFKTIFSKPYVLTTSINFVIISYLVLGKTGMLTAFNIVLLDCPNIRIISGKFIYFIN